MFRLKFLYAIDSRLLTMLMTVGRLPKHRICLQCLIYIFFDNATLEQVIVSSNFFLFYMSYFSGLLSQKTYFLLLHYMFKTSFCS